MLRRLAYRRALRWANRQRRKRGHVALEDLPVGRPRADHGACPLELAVPGIEVSRGIWRERDARGWATRWRYLPPMVALFIHYLDAARAYAHLTMNLKEWRETQELLAERPRAQTSEDWEQVGWRAEARSVPPTDAVLLRALDKVEHPTD